MMLIFALGCVLILKAGVVEIKLEKSQLRGGGGTDKYSHLNHLQGSEYYKSPTVVNAADSVRSLEKKEEEGDGGGEAENYFKEAVEKLESGNGVLEPPRDDESGGDGLPETDQQQQQIANDEGEGEDDNNSPSPPQGLMNESQSPITQDVNEMQEKSQNMFLSQPQEEQSVEQLLEQSEIQSQLAGKSTAEQQSLVEQFQQFLKEQNRQSPGQDRQQQQQQNVFAQQETSQFQQLASPQLQQQQNPFEQQQQSLGEQFQQFLDPKVQQQSQSPFQQNQNPFGQQLQTGQQLLSSQNNNQYGLELQQQQNQLGMQPQNQYGLQLNHQQGLQQQGQIGVQQQQLQQQPQQQPQYSQLQNQQQSGQIQQHGHQSHQLHQQQLSSQQYGQQQIQQQYDQQPQFQQQYNQQQFEPVLRQDPNNEVFAYAEDTAQATNQVIVDQFGAETGRSLSDGRDTPPEPSSPVDVLNNRPVPFDLSHQPRFQGYGEMANNQKEHDNFEDIQDVPIQVQPDVYGKLKTEVQEVEEDVTRDNPDLNFIGKVVNDGVSINNPRLWGARTLTTPKLRQHLEKNDAKFKPSEVGTQ
jgi:hypothetical protein